MKKIVNTFIALALLLMIQGHSEAQEIRRRIKLDGTIKYVAVPKGTTKLVLYGTARSKMTSYLQVIGTVPKRTKISMRAQYMKREVVPIKKRKSFMINLDTQEEIQNNHDKCLPIKIEGANDNEEDTIDVADFPAIENPICDLFAYSDKVAIAEQLGETFGGEWGLGNVCAFIVSVSNEPDLGGKTEWCAKYDWHDLLGLGIDCFPSFLSLQTKQAQSRVLSDNKSFSYRGLFKKDACHKKSKPKYTVELTLNLKQVNWDKYPDGTNVVIRVNNFQLSQGKEAALKPKSEGRYAPKPIMMMNWLGSSCGNKIDVVTWERNKPISTKHLNVYVLLAYKNLVLNLALVDSALTGRKGTVELYNGNSTYGVCFNMVRKRQNRNNYPR